MAEKESRTFKVNGDVVSVHHKTITADNDKGIWFDTTFDFSNVSREQLLKWAADQRVIAWRAQAGVKKLTTNEIMEKGLVNVTVDCSKVIERAKHVKTEEEKEQADLIKKAVSAGMSIKEINRLISERLELLRKSEDDELSEEEDSEAEEKEENPTNAA